MKGTKVAHKRISAPRIVQPGSGYSSIIVGLFLILLLVLGWQTFEYGRVQAGFDTTASARVKEQLVARIDQQQQQISGLRLEAAKHQRAAEIATDAARKVQDDLVALEEDRAELRKEVGFLRGLVAESSGPLYIKDFRLKAGTEEGQFHYYMTVAQMLEKVKTTKAGMTMILAGKLAGKSEQLKMVEFDQDKRESRSLTFKHFYDLEGVIVLPEGFEPESLSIEISPKSKKLKKLTKVFEWSVSS